MRKITLYSVLAASLVILAASCRSKKVDCPAYGKANQQESTLSKQS